MVIEKTGSADHPKPLLIYIASDVRSGSTLLDMLLGAHHDILSIGELQFLKDHIQRKGTGYSWDWRCTCGKNFSDCQFWSDISRQTYARTGVPLKSMETWVKRSNQFFPFLLMPNSIIKRLEKSFDSIRKGLESAQNCWRVIDEISSLTQKKLIVDSSKNAEQFRFLFFFRPNNLKMIFLIRDGRAVTYSKITRTDDSTRKSAKNWVVENLKLIIIKTLFCRKNSITVKYESLCRNPQKEIDRITNFLLISNQEIKLSKEGRHNICGSPHRFDKANTTIKLDKRWKNQLPLKEKKTFNILAGWLNFLWGYR